MKKDLHDRASYGLKGRVVTMKSENEVFNNATVYVNSSEITAIVKSGTSIPAALKNLPVYETGGTIFPGFIELHNHLSYNCLPVWPVPKKFENRDQWSGIDLYRNLISGPMGILGKTPGYVEAIVRYVECKCLVAGVTTSQGIMLYSNAGIRKYYQGIVRNVEAPDDAVLPRVDAHIPDIASKDAAHFLTQLNKASCLLLHLSEGTDKPALGHFESLKISANAWAITSTLTGIHCVALKPADFHLMNEKGASMVWSPLSNLMLYGATADIAAAKASGIAIGIGSDWSPSGSKNLLGELKVAKLFSERNGHIFSDYELISMATKSAAKIIKWDKHIGTVEKGKLADFLVVDGTKGNPFNQLLHASEKELSLVVINGVARCGSKELMKNFSGKTEKIRIGDANKFLNLSEATENPVVGKISLSAATAKLKAGLKDLKSLAKKMPPLKEITAPDNSKFFVPQSKKGKGMGKPSFVLVLDHDEEEGENIRHHLTTNQKSKGIKKPEPLNIPSIKLDLLCVDNDKKYFKNLKANVNLPDYIKSGLESFY